MLNNIGAYGVYQSRTYGSQTQQAGKSATESAKERAAALAEEKKAEKAEKKQEVKLSARAQALLEKLQSKYSNMDFKVANYASEEEAAAYLSGGTKEYSVLIEPEILEQMAADDKIREKYEGLMETGVGELDDLKSWLGDKYGDVKNVGISIGKDGTMSYFAELEKSSAKQRERIEASREKKAEEAADAQKKADGKQPEEGGKRAWLKADSIEDLLYQIRHMDWSKVKDGQQAEAGSRIDYAL